MATMSGGEVYDRIQANITGRIAIHRNEAVLHYNTIQPGDLYLEVGCLWGGTAILAAMKAARVLTIDFMMGGFWVNGDPGVKYLSPSPAIILDNLAKFQVAHKVSVIKTSTYPWPIPYTIHPDVMLVDAGHSYESACHDWGVARKITKRAILVHDYHRARQHKGVVDMVEQHALNDPDWEMTDHVQTLALFTRRKV